MQHEQGNKRERVLRAAQECFTRYGFKRTTMDDIARQATISRPALYLLFANKEAIFRALAEALNQAALARAESALLASGALEDRLVAAFEGKDLELIGVVESSAHGVELMELKDTIAADIAEHAERRFQELLTEALRQAAHQGEITFARIGIEASECAELLILAVSGVKRLPCRLDPYRLRLPQVVRVFCVALTSQ